MIQSAASRSLQTILTHDTCIELLINDVLSPTGMFKIMTLFVVVIVVLQVALIMSL